jgi:hypothetical protein
VWRNLRGYPIYAAPFARSNPALSREEMDANYRRFLEQKPERLQYLAGYLAAFSVPLRLEPEALPPLERWLDRYGGHLIPARGSHLNFGGDPAVTSALCNRGPAWAGEYHGLNIINDIAIFAGEYIISKNNEARWGMWYGDGEKRDRQTGVFGHLCIFGLRHFSPEHHYSMLMEIFECCHHAHCRLDGRFFWWPRQQPGDVVRRLSYLAAPTPEPADSASSDKKRKARKGRDPLVHHKGVKIYEALKGEKVLRSWYALLPNQDEDSDKKFDVRRLPRKYRSGLLIEDRGTYDFELGLSEQQRFFAALDAEREAHVIAIERAIDDGYDFNSAARGNYGQFVRRLVRSTRRGRIEAGEPDS